MDTNTPVESSPSGDAGNISLSTTVRCMFLDIIEVNKTFWYCKIRSIYYSFFHEGKLPETCLFITGVVTGGKEIRIGFANTEEECAELVRIAYGTASGASWVRRLNEIPDYETLDLPDYEEYQSDGGGGQCWAKFGDKLRSRTNTVYRSCIFKGKFIN